MSQVAGLYLSNEVSGRKIMNGRETYTIAPVVHVVDDDDSFRESVIRLLRANRIAAKGYRCAGEFLLANPLDEPGCVLLDIMMPGPSGMELLKALRSRRIALPIVLLTGYDDVNTSVEAMKAGAVDYLVKPAPAERVLQAVAKALQRDTTARHAEQELSELRERFDELNPLERKILAGIMNNRLNKQLAADLGACERTIKARRARIRSKLQIRSLPDLVRASRLLEAYAKEQGGTVEHAKPASHEKPSLPASIAGVSLFASSS
jgi:FixJ family two-component response regulator